MVQWVKIKEDLWNVIYSERTKRIDSLTKLIAFSLILEIDINDIEIALLQMEEKDHNFAEFGVFKGLTYTKRMEN